MSVEYEQHEQPFAESGCQSKRRVKKDASIKNALKIIDVKRQAHAFDAASSMTSEEAAPGPSISFRFIPAAA